MEYCIKIEDVTKKYPHFTLDKINFILPKGSIMGLIGENGAGKTTIIKLILNLIQKETGSITVFGKDNTLYEKSIKEDLGVVLDDGGFYDALNAKDVNKIMKGIYKKWNEGLYFEYLNRFEVLLDKKIKEYSLGMKKKLSIAAALSHEAKLLLLDEAMSGLDPVFRAALCDVFMEFIQNENNSMVLSSHITTDLEKIADYITFIHKGKIVVNKNKDAILEEYGVLKCKKDQFQSIEKEDVLGYRKNSFGYEVLINNKKAMAKKYKTMIIEPIHLDDILLFYARGEQY